MSNKSESRPVGRPPGADADRTRAHILDAAVRAFADRGFDGASIREVTGAAGVGHNLVRHYFGSKEDLWRAAMHHCLDPVTSAIEELLQPDTGMDAVDALRAGLEVLFAEAGANPDAIKLLLRESLSGGTRFDTVFDEVLAPLGVLLIGYMNAMGDELVDVDPPVLGLFLFGAAFSGFAFDGLARRVGFQQPGHDGALNGHSHQLIGMMLSGLRSRS